jgi:hypothetical protein
MICKHERTRLLWVEPKDADIAYEIWKELHPESEVSLKKFWEQHNIIICCDCGAEISND